MENLKSGDIIVHKKTGIKRKVLCATGPFIAVVEPGSNSIVDGGWFSCKKWLDEDYTIDISARKDK